MAAMVQAMVCIERCLLLCEVIVMCLCLRRDALQGVTWTGLLNSRRTALGLKVDWAYAPGEVKIMTSSDGANFEEAKCWQPTGRGEAAFEESFMFDAPRSVKAVAVAMRGSQSWGYFGINSAALIAEPGPFMLVRCLVPFLQQCL